MKIKLIVIGNLKEDYLKKASDEYLKRLSTFAEVEIVELKEVKVLNETSATVKQAIDQESKLILSKIKAKEFTILLDIEGEQVDSLKLAKNLQSKINLHSQLTFIIGGSNGVSLELKNQVNWRWSLSKLTFPHQLTRVLLLEQLYRSFKINSNQPYHK
jgi:23S rRNA (pseudouridine1915-N3)-methyltransferase